MRIAAALFVTAALLTACGAPVPPCTNCANVAGRYLTDSPSMSADQSSCGTLFYNGGTGEIGVVQDQSAISVTNWFNVKGTMHDDLSVTFDSTDVNTSSGQASQMVLSGAFDGTEGRRTFTGTMNFTLKADSCTLTVPVTWTQLP